ncbi:BTAD domain-containing putative transcriptional regulator [Micromonospora sp. WMMA1998]|uniref:AfsR/SARP family transcriptional regulator n=1 Tax=Micromonospora sp. WMMA1998 TaxID=3015167 RepID=UPI00248B6E5B|nr:BTAD domain-containing putative transcriptional regulator [Micromonospora sp. WMMA1998]WBC14947.1 BTAD domain-containing putative transcriptional regulator [Micromonospora sp. WMMA1998]
MFDVHLRWGRSMNIARDVSTDAGTAPGAATSGDGAGVAATCPGSTGGAVYRASFFGAFRLWRDGQPLGEPNWRRNRAKTLLKWFLLNPSTPVSEQHLCTLLWPDRSREKAVNNLHVTVHFLRHVLQPGLPARGRSSFIRRDDRKFYWFDLNHRWWTDVQEVRQLSAAARCAAEAGQTDRAIALYRRSVGYYRLGFLPEDVYEDVFATYRTQFETAHVDALVQLTRLHLAADQLPRALTCASAVLAIDPYHERAVLSIVDVHRRQGNLTAAIRQLDDYLRVLREHLGVDPDTKLQALRYRLTMS